MLTPFDSEFAKHHIQELPKEISTFDDIASYTNEYDFECILPQYWKFTKKDFPELSDEEYKALKEDASVDEALGFEMWTSACLYDAVLNGTDYAPYYFGYAEEYLKAVEALRTALARKKFLSKKPLHNLPEILQNAVDALQYLLGDNNESELAEKMKQGGTYDAFRAEIIDLQSRLGKHIK